MECLQALPTYEPCTLQFKMVYAIFDLIHLYMGVRKRLGYLQRLSPNLWNNSSPPRRVLITFSTRWLCMGCGSSLLLRTRSSCCRELKDDWSMVFHSSWSVGFSASSPAGLCQFHCHHSALWPLKHRSFWEGRADFICKDI